MTTRRDFLLASGFALSLLAAPLRPLAQQQRKVWRVGFLSQAARPASSSDTARSYGAFLGAMHELGYVEGKNLVIDGRFADNRPERLPDLAAELVKLDVDIIVTSGVSAPLSAQKATATIPIVMIGVSDPVGTGLVKSLSRPGGNITGVSTISADLNPKRLELLLDMAPNLSRVAVLVNGTNPDHDRHQRSIQAAGQKRRVEILLADARTTQEIEKAFSWIRQQGAGALIVVANPLFQQHRSQIAELGAKHRLPAMTPDLIYAEAGCLMSYGSDLTDGRRRAATYVDKILKGAKPADLPVEQPTKLQLVINRKTANALGLAIPQSLLISADRVIE